MDSLAKIARILRADKDTVAASSGRDILDKIAGENETVMKEKMDVLGVKTSLATDIFNALLKKIEEDDKNLSSVLGGPLCTTEEGCRPLLSAAEKVAAIPPGFFLKEEKAREMILSQPPKNMPAVLGYSSAAEMLEREDLYEIFSALRFVEDGNWMNDVFLKQYDKLNPADFEERPIKTIVLGERWGEIAKQFLKKKYHNISHLKELGVIFVLPAVLGVIGETLRTLVLVLHYFHEIDFYSGLFRRYTAGDNFAGKLISSLRGDVLDEKSFENDGGKKWMIIQRYLAKDDENDWRLFVPHVNPEAVHWKKAERDIARLHSFLEGVDLGFWEDLNWVGDYFTTESGIDVLVSFNLVDTVMSLVKEKEMIKYLYHHQEALWNKIFYESRGEEKMERLIAENWEKGFIDLSVEE